MRARIKIICALILFVLGGCVLYILFPGVFDWRPEQCMDRSTAHYNEGLARLISAKGISNSVRQDRGVCFAKRDEAKVKAVAQELDRHFYEVADLMKDSCEEKAVVEWATRERLPHQVHDTKGAGGRPGRRMINIYSFSADEVASNRRKLEVEAPRGATCDGKAGSLAWSTSMPRHHELR